MSDAPPRVVVYTRQRCGLCRDAEALVHGLVPAGQVTLRDIDEDDELLRRFHLRVPVIEVDGTIVAEAPVDETAVRAALAPRRRRWFRPWSAGS